MQNIAQIHANVDKSENRETIRACFDLVLENDKARGQAQLHYGFRRYPLLVELIDGDWFVEVTDTQQKRCFRRKVRGNPIGTATSVRLHHVVDDAISAFAILLWSAL